MNTLHYNPQRRLPLLPAYFKWIGWALVIVIIIFIYTDPNEFGPIRASCINHPVIFLLSIVALLFIAYAAMRDEDEYTGLLRFRANRIALIVVLRNFLVATPLMEIFGYPRQSWFIVDYAIIYLGVYYAAVIVQRTVGKVSVVETSEVLETSDVAGASPLARFLKKYHAAEGLTGPYKVMDSIPQGAHLFKDELLKRINEKIKNEDDDDLDTNLAVAWRDGMDDDYKPVLRELLQASWHEQQEDIVGYIREFKDNDFTDDLYAIATDPSRWPYGDDNEPILRKCVHALKEINSDNSNAKVDLLKKTGNKNVLYALEVYW